jgi:phosphoribosylformylglycinamidine synthase
VNTGGLIDLNKLPVGDPTLSAKEIIGNESQKEWDWLLVEGDDTLQELLTESALSYVPSR